MVKKSDKKAADKKATGKKSAGRKAADADPSAQDGDEDGGKAPRAAFGRAMKDSAQQIWLAGLGAFAKAQAEGGKVFEALVKEGTNLQRQTRTATEEKLADVGSQVHRVATEVSAQAGQQWDRLESIFEGRTAQALRKLGIPTARDLEALSRRIDVLSAEVARLSQAPTPSATDAASGDRPPVRRKPAAKKAGTASAKRAAAQASQEPE